MTRLRIIFYLACFFPLILPSQFLAQDDFNMNGIRNQKIRINKELQTIPKIRTEINLNTERLDGDWKVFKNWNEGRAVVAESDSIVWVGTPVGLVRWNVASGTYQTFDENNGLHFTSINFLAIDKTSKLWIAATQGLAVYTEGIFSHYDYTNTSLPESSMEVVCIDNSNRVVVAFGPPLSGGYYQDGGIARFDGTNWQIWKYGSSVYWGPTYSMCTYRDTVWITGGQDLFVLSDETFDKAPNWSFGGASSIAVDYQDSLWVESFGQKILKRYGDGWKVIIEEIGGIFNRLWNDHSGGLWLSMSDIWWSGYGPYRLDIEKQRQGTFCGTSYPGICTIPGIPGQFYAHYALSATSQFFVSIGTGTTWPEYQTEQGGLYKFDGTNWQIFRVPTTILENEIYGLGFGHEGNVFVSTPFYTQKTNGENWETIGEWVTGVRSWNRDFRFAPDGLLFTNHHQMYPNKDSYSGYVTGLDLDGYGNLWAGYPMIRFKWPNFSQTNFTSTINYISQPYHPQIMDVIVDKNEHVWTAPWYYGSVMFDQTNWHPFPPSDTTLPNGNYDHIFADSKGRIWFATNQWSPNHGFTIYDGNKWETYYSPQRYSISYVYQIAEDHFGNIWLATGGGLLKYDGDSFTVFDSHNSPLSLNYTSAVTVDERGNIWIGTNNGLYVYNPNSTIDFGQYSFFSPVDSLKLTPLDKFAKVALYPNSPSSTPVRYQLQRGRGTHKFWTIKEVEYSSIPLEVEMYDSSDIIGQYYYRINEVTPDGKQRYSQAVQFIGGTPGVTLVDFEYYILRNSIFFKWQTRDESFVKRFELWRSDSLSGQFYLIKSVLSDTTIKEVRFYEIQGDTLGYVSATRQYRLNVVYLDSTTTVLQTINVEPEQTALPTTFWVSQNYPNPFNSKSTFNIEMPNSGLINLKFYDILGKEVLSQDEFLTEGYHHMSVEFSSFASGVYFYFINSLGKQFTGKMILLK